MRSISTYLGLIAIALLVAISMCSLGVPQGSYINTQLRELYLERAIATYNALLRYYYIPSLGLFRGNVCGNYSCLWPYSQVISAADYLASIPSASNMSTWLSKLYLGLGEYRNPLNPGLGYESAVTPPLGPGGTTYYDDNSWVALALIDAYMLTNNTTYLDRAEELFNFIVGGWSTNMSLYCPGGVYWYAGSGVRPRNTVSNAPAAEAGIKLYLITGNAYYLTWALKMFNWVNTCLRAPNGLYYDHIRRDQTIDETIWSYNQGTMAGAAALLYLATHNLTYLRLAEQIAYESMKYFSTSIYSQPPPFNAIYFRNIYLVVEVCNNETLAKMFWDMILQYANTTWVTYRDPETGLFTGSIPASAANPDDVIINTAAMVQIYSIIAGAPPMIPRYAQLAKAVVTETLTYLLIIVVVLAAVAIYVTMKHMGRRR